MLTEELKLSIINKQKIQKDDFHPKIFQEIILFSWKFLDFKSDLLSWISIQDKIIKLNIETAICSFAKEQFHNSHLTKSGMISVFNHLQSLLNIIHSKASCVSKYRSKL